jgi:hypothetical protein
MCASTYELLQFDLEPCQCSGPVEIQNDVSETVGWCLVGALSDNNMMVDVH